MCYINHGSLFLRNQIIFKEHKSRIAQKELLKSRIIAIQMFFKQFKNTQNKWNIFFFSQKNEKHNV